MATLQEQIAQAKAAGYSDADIAQHLSQKADLAPKIKTAMDAGYKPEDIIAHLSQQSDAPKPANAPDPMKAGRSAGSAVLQNIGNLAGGLVRGAGSIGSTILAPYDMAKDAIAGKGLSLESNRQRRADIDAGLQTMGAEPDSALYKVGKLGGEIAGTAGVGGVLANGVRAVAPGARALATAIETAGMRTGAAPGAMNMLTRIAGGSITGGATAGLINPEDVGTGAMIGGALPPVAAGAGATAKYAGRAVGSVVKPFTEAGQQEIAGNIVRKFADGGPTTLNTAQIVPGSTPTLAEATGNAGLATLQRGVRDLRPNSFVEREQLNAAARNALFDDVAGDVGKLEFYRASRSQAANSLYSEALDSANQQALTPYLKGQITQLLKRPSIDQASKTAQRWAIERGEKPSAVGSLRALHDVKTAIDDKIADAVRNGAGGEVAALQATKDKLLNVMEKLSPQYAEARTTYAQMSQPINAMETLQGMNLRDAQGNITLAKVQGALRTLQTKMDAPGANAAKSVSADQVRALEALRDDLLRQSNLGLGRSIGSNTFQNIATDNILNSFAGNTLSRLAGKVGIPGVMGQAGRLIYSGPNESIKNRLVDMMLQPQLATPALSGAAPTTAPNAISRLLMNPTAAQLGYRSAPALAPALVTSR